MNDATCAGCPASRVEDPGNLAESDPGCIMQCRLCIILASASKCMQITPSPHPVSSHFSTQIYSTIFGAGAPCRRGMTNAGWCVLYLGIIIV